MKILITGVAGFIGSNLADYFVSNDIDVIGIDDLSYGVAEQIPSAVTFHKIDIRDHKISNLFKGVDYVFHLAAKNSLIDCEQDPEETHDINVNGTENIFNASAKNNVKKVIYAESSAVYEGSSILPSIESDVRPQSVYAKSKLETNKLAKNFIGILILLLQVSGILMYMVLGKIIEELSLQYLAHL